MKSQCDAILDYLRRGKILTPLDALRLFGCFRLAARIHDLRSQGYTIETEIIELDDSRVACYWIPK